MILWSHFCGLKLSASSHSFFYCAALQKPHTTFTANFTWMLSFYLFFFKTWYVHSKNLHAQRHAAVQLASGWCFITDNCVEFD